MVGDLGSGVTVTTHVQLVGVHILYPIMGRIKSNSFPGECDMVCNNIYKKAIDEFVKVWQFWIFLKINRRLFFSQSPLGGHDRGNSFLRSYTEDPS